MKNIPNNFQEVVDLDDIIEINLDDIIEINSDEIIKNLTEENKRLKEQLDKKEDLFKYVIQVNNKYKRLIEYQENELHMIKKKLKSYINKDIKSKKKKKEINISEIIKAREQGDSYRKIAQRYRVSPSTIYYKINKAQK